MGTKIFCKNCGKLNDKSWSFCMQCGKPLPRSTAARTAPATVRCPKCGLSMTGEKRFCNSCGATLRQSDEIGGASSAAAAVPAIAPEDVIQCPFCGTVNVRFEYCFACGADLSQPLTVVPVQGDGRSASGRRRICSSCLGFFPVEEVTAFDGKHYCPSCVKDIEL